VVGILLEHPAEESPLERPVVGSLLEHPVVGNLLEHPVVDILEHLEVGILAVRHLVAGMVLVLLDC